MLDKYQGEITINKEVCREFQVRTDSVGVWIEQKQQLNIHTSVMKL